MRINKEIIGDKIKKTSVELSKHIDLILESDEKENKLSITMSDNVSNIIDITEKVSKEELRQIIVFLRDFYCQMASEIEGE